MAFDDLTSQRARRLLLTLLEEMDPDKYPSFLAFRTSEGWGVIIAGSAGAPQKNPDVSFEKPHLSELESAGYVQLEMKPKGSIEGWLTKRAWEESRASKGEALQGVPDTDLDDMVPQLKKKAAFERELPKMVSEATAEGYPFALVMIDGDGFKRVNDEHGHLVGDEVIRGLGEVIARRVRKRGSAYRFGGDEFAILLPNHAAAEAAYLAESIRADIEQASLSSLRLSLTATFGVACFPDHAREASGLFKAADDALRSAKKGGRNRVEIAASPQNEQEVKPAVHGDTVAQVAADELLAMATTAEREAALDAKAEQLLELCFEAFRARATRWIEQGTLAATTAVRKRTEPGGVFALEYQAPFRFSKNGPCAFAYDLWLPGRPVQVKGWVQVEVPVDSTGDVPLVVRWLSEHPKMPAERVLQQSASAIVAADALAQDREHAEGMMADVFGRAMNQLSKLAKDTADR